MFFHKSIILLLLLVAGLGGGMVFLANTSVPVPQHPVEKVLPHERFSK